MTVQGPLGGCFGGLWPDSNEGIRHMARMVQEHYATDHNAGGVIRKITVSLIGTAALAAGLVLLRQGTARPSLETATVEEVPPGEEVPGKIRLDRLRELGI